ncbi:hypothetical protein [Nocardia puris]|uniref:hypothetical protein n=1 Tax=Nocardia puris TaxID=208602 RepID=UPI002E225C89
MTDFVLSDGLSTLVIERDPDGRVRIAVHDRERPGFTVTCGAFQAGEIALFLRGTEAG